MHPEEEEKAAKSPERPKTAPEKFIANPIIVEKAIRKELKKPTGGLGEGKRPDSLLQ